MGKADRARAWSLSMRILKGELHQWKGRARVQPPVVVPARRVDAGAVAVTPSPAGQSGEHFVLAVDAVVTASDRTYLHDLTGYRVVLHPDSPVRVVSEEQRSRWGRASASVLSLLEHYVEPYGCVLSHVVFATWVAPSDTGRHDLVDTARLVGVAAGRPDCQPVIDLRREWATLAELDLSRAETVGVMPVSVRLQDHAAVMEVGQHLSRHLRARVGEPRR